jgi:hypothetical protein
VKLNAVRAVIVHEQQFQVNTANAAQLLEARDQMNSPATTAKVTLASRPPMRILCIAEFKAVEPRDAESSETGE